MSTRPGRTIALRLTWDEANQVRIGLARIQERTESSDTDDDARMAEAIMERLGAAMERARAKAMR
jgi:hypothetical protein